MVIMRVGQQDGRDLRRIDAKRRPAIGRGHNLRVTVLCGLFGIDPGIDNDYLIAALQNPAKEVEGQRSRWIRVRNKVDTAGAPVIRGMAYRVNFPGLH